MARRTRPKEPEPAPTEGAAPSARRLLLRRSVVSSLLGKTLGGRYRVDSLIGVGGMGSVYAATEVATGVEVAIKALSAGAFTTTNLRRFRREAEVARAVKHPSLCDVHYLGVEGGSPYIVMERLHGETLRTRLSQLGAFAPAEAVSIMITLLDGLAAAHEQGVIHRDVKPANVFLTTPRGAATKLKLIDFGLAKLLPAYTWDPPPSDGGHEGTAITSTDVVPGTPFYLAPEQLSGAKDLDERVDVWAAGLTFYEMLVGRRAYREQVPTALAREILFGELPSVASFRDDIPPGLELVLARALAKDRDARYASAAAFRAALLEEWARYRALGVFRGELLRSFRPEALTVLIEEVTCPDAEPGPDESTDLHVDIVFDPEGDA